MKVGDEVYLITKEHGVSKYNPVHGEYSDDIKGIVSKISNVSNFSIKVDWSNGENNVYNEKDLLLINKEDEQKPSKIKNLFTL